MQVLKGLVALEKTASVDLLAQYELRSHDNLINSSFPLAAFKAVQDSAYGNLLVGNTTGNTTGNTHAAPLSQSSGQLTGLVCPTLLRMHDVCMMISHAPDYLALLDLAINASLAGQGVAGATNMTRPVLDTRTKLLRDVLSRDVSTLQGLSFFPGHGSVHGFTLAQFSGFNISGTKICFQLDPSSVTQDVRAALSVLQGLEPNSMSRSAGSTQPERQLSTVHVAVIATIAGLVAVVAVLTVLFVLQRPRLIILCR